MSGHAGTQSVGSCQNRLGEPVLTSINDICFGTKKKKKKNVYLCKPQSHYITSSPVNAHLRPEIPILV